MIHALALLLFAFAPLFAQNGIAEQYNAIYSDDAEQATFNHSPNAFLVEFAKTLKPGRVLDVGMGQGRNTIYLAQQEWQATGFDLSDAGVKLAPEQGEIASESDCRCGDAAAYDFGEANGTSSLSCREEWVGCKGLWGGGLWGANKVRKSVIGKLWASH
jgi:SAM-dependent methyltransferase